MRGKLLFIAVFTLLLGCSDPQPSHALIVINEILADPASGIAGDANNDGVGHFSQDEFIEILNNSDQSIDLSSWYITDATSTRHIFDEGTTLLPYQYVVVFGGGMPELSDVIWQVSSSGSLGLNNGGDTVSLFDANAVLVNQFIYGSLGGQDQSLALFPEGEGDAFELHSTIVAAEGALFSPGTSFDGGDFEVASVPEPLSLISFGFGTYFLYRKRKKVREGSRDRYPL